MGWIDLDGAVNVRDLGGLPTIDGRTTRDGVLLRADNLQDLSEADVARLVHGLHLRTVVDLRSTGELHLTGPGPLAGAGLVHHHLSLIPEWDGEPDEAEVERALEDAVAARALPVLPPRRRQKTPNDLAGHYVGYVTEAGANVARALRVLAEPSIGTAVVHCAAGKDRTGVVVALALSLVGVTRDAVVADYVRSAERAEQILGRLAATDAYGPGLAGVSVADITPVASSMESFLDAVDRDYGGPHGLAMSLGVDEETVARLGVRLVGTSARAR
ncbi:MAG: tyrosine-protein phosphatase [Mycobacteriales bacterium]